MLNDPISTAALYINVWSVHSKYDRCNECVIKDICMPTAATFASGLIRTKTPRNSNYPAISFICKKIVETIKLS